MKEKTKRLRELQEQKHRRVHLESLRSELTKQQRELSEKTQALKAAMVNEQADVDALQKPGVKSLFYSLTGKKQQKLEREEKEANAARLSYERALCEQTELEQRLNAAEAELSSLGECTEEYDAVMKELLLVIRDETLAQQNDRLRIRMKQVTDAKIQIDEVKVQIEDVNVCLKEAERWASTVQINHGEAEERFMFDALDNARRGMGHLQEQIQQLKMKVSAFNIEAELPYHANVVSGMNNRMLSGTAVMQMVKHAYGQNYAVTRQLSEITEQLEYIQRKTEREMDDCCEKLLKMAEKG